MIKGPFMSVQLPEESRFPYLLLRDADENYWSPMGEKRNHGGQGAGKAR